MRLDQFFTPLNEVHYTDFYPASFEAFRKKYAKLVREGRTHDLYVQFTSVADAMTRTPVQNPTHSDPVGVYAYPLAYVVSRPADIWYGRGARFLRVLQDHSKKKLFFPDDVPTRTAAVNLLAKMGMDYQDAMAACDAVRKRYKARTDGPNREAKVFMSAFQMAILEPSTGEDGYSQKTYRVRSGHEQTAMLRKAGYDAVEDTAAGSSSATINDREPEQIIFLTRAAFRVLEVIPLRPNAAEKKLPGMNYMMPDTPMVERPFVAAIAQLMDDRLKQGPLRSNLGGWSYYWTAKGRRIEVHFAPPSSYHDRKIGEKRHKMFKTDDQHDTYVKIRSERGVIEAVYDATTKFKDILSDLKEEWVSLADQTSDWQPENYKAYQEKQDAARKEQIRQKLEKERQQRLRYLPDFLKELELVSDYYGVPVNIPEGEEEHLMDMIREFTKYCWNKHRPDFDEGVQKSKEMVEDAPVFQKAIPAYHQALAVIRKAVNDPTVRDNDQFYWVENSQETIFDHIWLILTTGKAFRQRAG